MTSETLSNHSSSLRQQTAVKLSPMLGSSRLGAISAIVIAALLTGSLISSTESLGDDSVDRIVSYLQISSLFVIFFSILLALKSASQSAPFQKEAEGPFPQAYPKDIASRIEKRENLMQDSYKEGFRNLVFLLVSFDMPLEEAEPLLHFLAVMEPEKRKEIYDLLREPLSSAATRDNRYVILQAMLLNPVPIIQEQKSCLETIFELIQPKTQIAKAEPHPHSAPSDGAKPTGCPLQRIWALPGFSSDPLVVLEALSRQRFAEKFFKDPVSDRSNQEIFLQKTSILACSPDNTPRYRKIFFDLILKKKREKLLQHIIRDHFDHFFETACDESQDSFDHLLEETCYDPKDPLNLIAPLGDCLRKIASCILDEIPLDWRSTPPALNLAKFSKSQLFQDLRDAGYTHEESVTNLRLLAGVIEQNGKSFLSTLLVHLYENKPEAQNLLAKIRQDVQRQIENGKDVWDVIKETKEIDMIILESLRMSHSLPPIERTLSESGKAIEISLDALAKRADLVGEKPEQFRPARLAEGASQRISNYWPSAVSWMPFGSGVHLCPGWGLYQMMSRYMVVKFALADFSQ